MPNLKKPRTFDDFLALLQEVKMLGVGKYTAICPAHRSNNKLLHITYKNRRISLRCEGGCLTENVVAVMSLTMADLSLNSGGFEDISPDWDKPRDNTESTEMTGKPEETCQSMTAQNANKEPCEAMIKPKAGRTEIKYKTRTDDCKGQIPNIPERMPSELVPGAELLDRIADFYLQYVVLTSHQANTLALWTCHTYNFGAADATPYINVNSPEKQSGKTRLLEVGELVVNKPWLTGRVTPAVLARKVDKEEPTLLLDESDAAFKSGDDYAEALRGILNTGHRRGGKTSVCIGQGAKIDYKDLSTFCPKAIAGIGKLTDTVSDRSIPMILKRKTASEHVERFRRKMVEPLAQILRDNLIALSATLQLTGAKPELPQELDDRAQDGWEPLLAIADAVGGGWPQKARAAAIDLSCGGVKDDQSLGTRLLGDIRHIFEEKAADRLPSAEIVQELNAMEDAPWVDINHKPLTTNMMARLLKPYGVRSGNVRQGATVPKGYMKADFADAWKRYTPALSGNQSATSATLASNHSQPETATVPQNNQDVADKSQHQRSLECSGVAVSGQVKASESISQDDSPEPPHDPADDIPPEDGPFDGLEPWEVEARVKIGPKGERIIGAA